MDEFTILNVSKFQNQIFLFSFEPKNQRNYFLISVLTSKDGLNQKKMKARYYIDYGAFKKIGTYLWVFYLTYFRSLGFLFDFWFKSEQENLLLKFTDL